MTSEPVCNVVDFKKLTWENLSLSSINFLLKDSFSLFMSKEFGRSYLNGTLSKIMLV